MQIRSAIIRLPTEVWRLLQVFAIYMLAALLVSTILNFGFLTRLAVETGDKIGMPLLSSRTDASDNYVYFSLIKRGVSACHTMDSASANIDGNPLACTYVGALLVGHAMWELCRALTISPRAAASLLLVLNTALLAFTFLLAFTAMVQRPLSIAASIALAGAALYCLDNFSTSLYFGKLYLYFREILDVEPNFARLLNPPVFWALGLATIAAVLHYMRANGGSVSLVVTLMLAGICGISGLAVTATLVAGIGLYLVIRLVIDRKLDWPLALIAMVLTFGIGHTFLRFYFYYGSELGKSVAPGQSIGIKPNFGMLILMVPIAFGRVCSERNQNLLMKCVLFAAVVVGMFCDSVALGNRLWLRGSAAIALLICLAWLWQWARFFIDRFKLSPRERDAERSASMQPGWLAPVATAIAIVGLLLATWYGRPPHLDKARGFLDRDKYDVLVWLDGHVTLGMSVASTNIEDSFLVDFYTRGSPFVPLYGLTILPDAKIIERYFWAISPLRDADTYFYRVRNVKKDALFDFNTALVNGFKQPYDYWAYQPLAFYHMLLYYPFNRSAPDTFSGNMPADQFLKWLIDLRDKAPRETFSYDYLIVRTDEPLKDPSHFEVAYENKSYVVLHPKSAD